MSGISTNYCPCEMVYSSETAKEADVFKKGKVDIADFTGQLGQLYTKNGQFIEEGTVIKRIDLADTLDVIASQGSNALYDGKLTQSVLNAVNAGLPPDSPWMTKDDLKNYEVKERAVVKGTYHDSTIISVLSPGSGPVVISMMNFMEGYNLQPSDSNTANMFHRFIEASKFAFAQQQFLGDPDFNDVSINNATNIMISKDVASQHRKITTNVTQQDPSVYGAMTLSALDGGTSHISIVDAQELMVSVTTTVNSWFGSKLMTESGILLNNQMADFNSAATGGNQMNKIEPGKRPLSNMSPTILYNTDHACKLRVNPWCRRGTFYPIRRGGDTVKCGVIREITHRSNTGPKDGLPPGSTDEGIKQSIIDNLKARGHKLEKTTDILSIVQGVKKVMDKVEAYADNRKGGHAATFNNH
ncbi:hypothetical protein FSP39_012107 [Pinctada imbricata]|uniref:Gamma-glutamyltransferase n=1 Tax=Pinctada imbricata TaxID=66713 RepID=A0AA89BXA5_PINIB|nr:hypothetical protein FSP39_012107 [Pinctada imbricata]